MPFNYSAVNDRPIVIGVDASLQGWGGYLNQMSKDRKHRHMARYENDIWSAAEARYNVEKREYYELLKIFKKLRHYLYKIHFVLELDVRTLIYQLNHFNTDLPNILVNNWLI